MSSTQSRRNLLRAATVLAGCSHLLALSGAPAAQVGTVRAEQKISATAGGFGGVLDVAEQFGGSVAALGDLDGDGIPDLAVGASADDDGGANQGAVWILFLEADGTVRAEQKISALAGGFGGALDVGDQIGVAVAALGDLDGDGVTELAVGSLSDDDGGTNQGGIWILFLNADGTVKAEQKISETAGGFAGLLDSGDHFGFALAALGDLDGDGLGELATSTCFDDDGGSDQGAAWILFLNADGSVKSEQKISATTGGFGGDLDAFDLFGYSVASLGDLDGDGRPDLAVGAPVDDDGGPGWDAGAVWILFLNADGSVKSEQKISATAGGFGGELHPGDELGVSVVAAGDIDGDGVVDLAVGADGDDDGGGGGFGRLGAAWILFLRADGSVKAEQKVSAAAGGFVGPLDTGDWFGRSVASVGDLDGDGTAELAVGAVQDDDGGGDQGAVWILFLEGRSCLTLDFQTEDDLVTPLQNGQHIDTEFGRLVSITSSGANAGLAIFDSTPGGPNDPSQDRDLLVGTGNVLILQTENYPPDGDDVFPRPNDDEDGGTMTFGFTSAVSPASVRLIDLDSGDGAATVVLTDEASRRRTYTLPSNWTGDLLLSQPGQGTLDLTTLADQPGFGSTATAAEEAGFDPEGVREIAVHLAGSGGVDDLTVCSASLPRASVRVRNGSGGNARNLSAASPPVLGSVFRADLDCSELGSGVAVLSLRRHPRPGSMTPFGELLIAGPLLSRTTQPFSAAVSRFAWDVPPDLALLGLDAHLQGFCRGAPRASPGKTRSVRGRLSNALDLVLGF